MQAWPVADRHLGHPRAGQPQQGGQEAVHAVERRNAMQEIGAVGAQGASDIGDRFAGDPIADPVRDARRGPAQPAVLPVGADAADDIVGTETNEEPGDVRRIVLQIGVERDQGGAASVAEAGRERRRLVAVAPQADHPHTMVLCRQSAQDLRAAVRAAVVDVEDFVVLAGRVHGRADLGRQDGQAFGFVEERNDQRDLGVFHPFGAPRMTAILVVFVDLRR